MPSGFLLCNGASVSRSDYPDLAEALGETGDTFALPDYRDRVPQGAGTVSPNVEVEAGLPVISGKGRTSAGLLTCERLSNRWVIEDSGGAFSMVSSTAGGAVRFVDTFALSELTDDESVDVGFEMDASRSSSVYGASSTVQMASYTNHFLIKT